MKTSMLVLVTSELFIKWDIWTIGEFPNPNHNSLLKSSFIFNSNSTVEIIIDFFLKRNKKHEARIRKLKQRVKMKNLIKVKI